MKVARFYYLIVIEFVMLHRNNVSRVFPVLLGAWLLGGRWLTFWFVPVIVSLGHHWCGFSPINFLQCILLSPAGFTFTLHLLKSDLVCVNALFFFCVILCFLWFQYYTPEELCVLALVISVYCGVFTLFEHSSMSFALSFEYQPMSTVCGLLRGWFGFAEFSQVSWVHETGIIVSQALLRSAEVW